VANFPQSRSVKSHSHQQARCNPGKSRAKSKPVLSFRLRRSTRSAWLPPKNSNNPVTFPMGPYEDFSRESLTNRQRHQSLKLILPGSGKDGRSRNRPQSRSNIPCATKMAEYTGTPMDSLSFGIFPSHWCGSFPISASDARLLSRASRWRGRRFGRK
jgi:hypothetical protein